VILVIEVMEDPASLAMEAAHHVTERALSCAKTRGSFTVALSGGNTPHAMFQRLAMPASVSVFPWDRTQVFFSDERFVPPSSPDSNYAMARDALLSHVAVDESSVHAVPTTDVHPEESAAQYERAIRRAIPIDPTGKPSFDLILLGLGPDGHTASLFPGSHALNIEDRLVAANWVRHLDAWRITFTFPLINAAHNVMFLVQGEDKAERVRQVFEGDPSFPASRVQPHSGRVSWLLDRAAASQLPSEVLAAHAPTS
jgi:6-phosphogluconolactonase